MWHCSDISKFWEEPCSEGKASKICREKTSLVFSFFFCFFWLGFFDVVFCLLFGVFVWVFLGFFWGRIENYYLQEKGLSILLLFGTCSFLFQKSDIFFLNHGNLEKLENFKSLKTCPVLVSHDLKSSEVRHLNEQVFCSVQCVLADLISLSSAWSL